MSLSRITMLACFLVIALVHFFYMPSWQYHNTNATISWDVSGYYMYLPATFIYNDLKKCEFQEEMISKYRFSPQFDLAFVHEESGNYVMKYPVGMAIMYAPFFGLAHLWASISSYPADGFSRPYQFMISFGSLLVTLLGLVLMRLVLKEYFSDGIVAAAIFVIAIGTNYLNYTAVVGAMSHNYLFTLYAALLLCTSKFYRKPSFLFAMLIGAIVGMAALSRPTEIMSAAIPLLWGISISKNSIGDRFKFISSNLKYYASAILLCIGIGCIQLLYWKWASGDWIVYSYQDEGFSWLKPHIYKGFLSYKAGWLVYTPVMIFSLIGFYFLYRSGREMFSTILLYFLLFTYVAFAWDIWWYGGSLGQRTMIQIYPLLAFPLGAFFEWLKNKGHVIRILSAAFLVLFIYANLWFTHQAHRGGLFYAGQMNKGYFWKVLFTYEKNRDDLKLLDVSKIFEGERTHIEPLNSSFSTKAGQEAELPYLLSGEEALNFSLKENELAHEWLRVNTEIRCISKEWNKWKMTLLIVRFMKDGKTVREKWIRLQRLVEKGEKRDLFFDVEIYADTYDEIQVEFRNGGGQREIEILKVGLELFDEK